MCKNLLLVTFVWFVHHFYLSIHLRVRIERVTTTAALSQHLQQQLQSQQDGGAIELQTLTPQGQTGKVVFCCRAKD